MMTQKLIVLGDAFVDISVGPLDWLPEWGRDVECSEPFDFLPGGSALNTAVHMNELAKGGDTERVVEVELWCSMGTAADDPYRDVLTKHLRDHGVKTRQVATASEEAASSVARTDPTNTSQRRPDPAVRTGVCLVLHGAADRAFVTNYGATGEFGAGGLDAAWLEGASHLHIGGFYNCRGLDAEGIIPFLEECRRRSVTVSLDPNCDGSGCWRTILRLLPHLDVFLPNEEEAHRIADVGDEFDDVVAFYRERVRLTVITRGERGAVAVDRGGRVCLEPGRVVETVVDPTGAGDAFDAGFLYAWKLWGDVGAALEFGTCSASVCIQKRGASKTPNQFEEVQSLLQNRH